MIKRAARRFVDREGESVVIRNYTQDGTDDYGDPLFTESTESTTAVIRLPNEPGTVRSPDGQEVRLDARVWLMDTVSINEPTESNPRGSEIERDISDDRLQVQTAFKDDNGLIRCECSRLEK